MLSGISNADDTLILMVEHLKSNIIKNALIQKTIKWIHKILPTTQDYESDAFKRVFLASLLLRYKRYDPAPLIGFENPRLELNAIELMNSLNSSQTMVYSLKPNMLHKEGLKILEIVSEWGIFINDFDSIKQQIQSVKFERPLSQCLFGTRHEYGKHILNFVYEALQVSDDIGFPRRNMYKELVSYLEAYTLIIDCKNSSLRLSKETWKSICLNLLSL